VWIIALGKHWFCGRRDNRRYIGFVTGFAEGAGNAYIAGQSNIGRAGLRAGTSGAAFGGVLGGISGGIQASNSGRDFWTGDAVEYDIPATLYAGNGTGESPILPDNATAYVHSDATIGAYYKPEDGLYGARNYISPGKYIVVPIDGVATTRTARTGEIFKVPTGSVVQISKSGQVTLAGNWVPWSYTPK
jgi:hypothetical protein